MAKHNRTRKASTDSYVERSDECLENKKTGNKRKDTRKTGSRADYKSTNKFYGGNDVSWYTRNADLTNSAAKFPFAYQPGRTLDLGQMMSSDETWSKGMAYNDALMTFRMKYDYPGFMVFSFRPSVGRSTDIASPINVAARETYARVRSKYSGSLEADAPDIMMYTLAIDSLYMLLEDMKRAYYLINSVTPYNNMFPKLAIKALGYDYDDLLANRTRLYQNIVELSAMLKKFMVPDNMDLFKRHQFMCANVYSDSPTAKSQQYMFKLDGIYLLDNTDKMTSLVSSKRPEQYCTVSDAYDWFKEGLDAIMNWDTSYTITGYLERAFEGDSFLIPAPVIEDAILSPVYNPEILLQIHNAVVTPVVGLDVTQDPINNNMLISKPVSDPETWVSTPNKAYSGVPTKALLSIPSSQQPDPASIIISTRLATTALGLKDTDDFGRLYVSCGTEVLTEVEFWNGMDENPQYAPISTAIVMYSINNDTVMMPVSMIKFLSYMTAFSYHPHIYIATMEGEEDNLITNPDFYLFSEVDNITAVDSEDVANLHRMCIYSEFNAFK